MCREWSERSGQVNAAASVAQPRVTPPKPSRWAVKVSSPTRLDAQDVLQRPGPGGSIVRRGHPRTLGRSGATPQPLPSRDKFAHRDLVVMKTSLPLGFGASRSLTVGDLPAAPPLRHEVNRPAGSAAAAAQAAHTARCAHRSRCGASASLPRRSSAGGCWLGHVAASCAARSPGRYRARRRRFRTRRSTRANTTRPSSGRRQPAACARLPARPRRAGRAPRPATWRASTPAPGRQRRSSRTPPISGSICSRTSGAMMGSSSHNGRIVYEAV